MVFRKRNIYSTGILALVSQLAGAQTLSTETPAVVQLTSKLDSAKIASQGTIQTILTEKIRLPDGTSIPKGTRLIAVVIGGTDSVGDRPKLVFRFAEVKLKKRPPLLIRATILDLATTQFPLTGNASIVETLLPVPRTLTNQTDEVFAHNILPGIDLHANASNSDSGVLLSTRGERIVLPVWTKLLLAIAADH